MTVTLSNYDIDSNSKTKDNWFTSIQYGTGKGFPIQMVDDGYYLKLEPIIKRFDEGKKFIEIINNGFSEKIGNKLQLQEMYEKQVCIDNLLEPTILIDKIPEIHITRFHSRDVVRHQLVQKIVEAYEGWDSEQQRLTAAARAERKALQEALVAENDSKADEQHQS